MNPNKKFDIAFCGLHKKYGGLSCNGGTKTILRSCQTLKELGYKTRVCARVDKFKYFKHEDPYPGIVHCKYAVAIDVLETKILELFKGNPKKFLWLRGWPLWQMKQPKIVKLLQDFKGTVICNSSWLIKKVAKYGVEAKLCYAGYDPVWNDFDRPETPYITIGSLQHHRHKTKNYKFFLALRKVLKGSYNFLEIGNVINNDEQLKAKYKKTDIWFAPTELEGFHNVPLEAALCGAAIVCSDHPRNGMSDYCTNETATIYRHKSLEDAVEKIYYTDFNKVKVMQNHIRTKIGTRKENMKKFIKILEES